MTHELYRDDPNLLEFEATLVSQTRSESGWEVVLDRSAFYPGGGG